jgi:multiple sugar transport system permease protein
MPSAERTLHFLSTAWIWFAMLLGLATLIGLIYAFTPSSSLVRATLASLRGDALDAACITFALYLCATTIQVGLALIAISYIGAPGPLLSFLLVLPFSVGVAAPATIARALLQPALSGNHIAEYLTPLATGLGVSVVVIVLDTWQWLGLLILALGLQLKSAAREFKDFATVEGFSRFQIIRWLIVPTCRYVILVYGILKLMDWLKKEDLIRALVGDLGGHQNRTTALLLSRWYYSANDVQTPVSVLLIFAQLIALFFLIRILLRLEPVRRLLWLQNHENS